MMSVCTGGDCGGVFRFNVPLLSPLARTRCRSSGHDARPRVHDASESGLASAFCHSIGSVGLSPCTLSSSWLESALPAAGVKGKRKETNSELSPVNSIIAARSTALPNPIHTFPGWCGTQTCQKNTWCFSSSLFVLIHIDVVNHMHVSIGRSHMLTSVGG